MSSPKMFCIAVSGIRLSNSALDSMFQTARRMIIQKKHEMRLCHDDVAGKVFTDYEEVTFIDLVGYRFFAEVSNDKGSSHAEFLVRHQEVGEDVSKAEWQRLQLHSTKKLKRRSRQNDQDE